MKIDDATIAGYSLQATVSKEGMLIVRDLSPTDKVSIAPYPHPRLLS